MLHHRRPCWLWLLLLLLLVPTGCGSSFLPVRRMLREGRLVDACEAMRYEYDALAERKPDLSSEELARALAARLDLRLHVSALTGEPLRQVLGLDPYDHRAPDTLERAVNLRVLAGRDPFERFMLLRYGASHRADPRLAVLFGQPAVKEWVKSSAPSWASGDLTTVWRTLTPLQLTRVFTYTERQAGSAGGGGGLRGIGLWGDLLTRVLTAGVADFNLRGGHTGSLLGDLKQAARRPSTQPVRKPLIVDHLVAERLVKQLGAAHCAPDARGTVRCRAQSLLRRTSYVPAPAAKLKLALALELRDGKRRCRLDLPLEIAVGSMPIATQLERVFGRGERSLAEPWPALAPTMAPVTAPSVRRPADPRCFTCSSLGECGHVAGSGASVRCQPRDDADCRAAEICRRIGHCKGGAGACSVDAAGCRSSQVCRRFGWCQPLADVSQWHFPEGVGCGPGSDADCAAARACRDSGECSVQGRFCRAQRDDDCARSTFCRRFGLCAAVAGHCRATKAADCQASQTCRRDGACRLASGVCLPR